MYSPILPGRQGLRSLLLLVALCCQLLLCFAQEDQIPLEAAFQPAYDRALDRGSSGPYPTQHFYSSKLKVPKFNYLKWSPECATKNDFYFITPKGWKVPNPGPMVLDHRGELVWADHFDNEFGGQAYDLMVQEYLGEKFLTFWLGDDRIRGHGTGHFHMINPAYDTIHRIGAADGRSADLHEFRLTPQGTALIIVFEPVAFDVRPAGRDFDDVWNQYIWDCLIQEVDIKTGDAVFEWRASEHLAITNSFHTIADRSEGLPDSPYDPFHFNSVDKDDLGNYLVSARYTHAVYYISGSTNEVIWTLGGKNNSFMDLSTETALNFAWQHDARFVQPDAFPETYAPPPAKDGFTTKLLTLFDNAAEDWHYQYGPPNARGLLLEITFPTNSIAPPRVPKEGDEKQANIKASSQSTILSNLDAYKVLDTNSTDPAYTVRVIQEYTNAATGRASSQGSMQLVSTEPGKDPHILLGHGINAVVQEYSSNGTLLCDMHFASQSTWEKGDVQSYRALKFPDWVGRPHVCPDVAVHGHDVYVSWNGATGVHEWVLQTWEGDADDHWKAAVIGKKTGFETKLEIPKDRRRSKFLRVTALDVDGHPLEYGVSEAYEKGLLYGRKKAQKHSWLQRLGLAVGILVSLALAFRFVRRCYNLRQRRRYGKWRLP